MEPYKIPLFRSNLFHVHITPIQFMCDHSFVLFDYWLMPQISFFVPTQRPQLCSTVHLTREKWLTRFGELRIIYSDNENKILQFSNLTVSGIWLYWKRSFFFLYQYFKCSNIIYNVVIIKVQASFRTQL